MRRGLIVALALAMSFAAAGADDEQPKWTEGPAKAELGEATLDVPAKYIFTGRDGARYVLKQGGNLLTDQEVGLVTPQTPPGDKQEHWFVVFEYDPMGHVKDDERHSIDANALLEGMREGNRKANEQKRRQGLPTLDVVAWAVQPHYDETTHNLEWGLTLHSKQGEQDMDDVVNYEVRLLGREGVMRSTLVISPTGMDTALPAFRALLKGFSFRPGRRYAEYRQGDRLAQVGLTALIGGGAVAVAAKSGLLKYLWKILVAAGVAIVAFLRRIFGSTRKPSPEPPPMP